MEQWLKFVMIRIELSREQVLLIELQREPDKEFYSYFIIYYTDQNFFLINIFTPSADILLSSDLNNIYINSIIKDWAIICWQLFKCQSHQFDTNLTP